MKQNTMAQKVNRGKFTKLARKTKTYSKCKTLKGPKAQSTGVLNIQAMLGTILPPDKMIVNKNNKEMDTERNRFSLQ